MWDYIGLQYKQDGNGSFYMDSPDWDGFKKDQYKDKKIVIRGNQNYLESVQEEDKPLRIKSLCSNWLKMQNVVCLIGAGASFDVGCSLSDMTKIVELSLDDENLRNFFTKRFNNERGNFEDNLSRLVALSNVLRSEEITQLEDDITHDKIDELLKVIQATILYCCNLKLPDSFSNDDTHRNFIRKLIGRSDRQLSRVKLITTNYDTLLEQAMDSLGVLYMDSFVGTVNRKFDTSCYGLDYYYPGEQSTGSVARYDKFLHLYKIHGSINWWSESDSDRLVWKNIDDSILGYYEKKGTLKNTEQINKAKNLLDNKWLGIQPTNMKYSETMNMPYSHLFRYFANAVRESQTVCFVIGYSFGDKHINNVIYDALASPSFNLVIVAPSLSEEACKILQSEELDRVYWFGGKLGEFKNFVKDVMPDLAEIETETKINELMKKLKTIEPKQTSQDEQDDDEDLPF